MGQTFHKFRAETFDEAYQKMVRALGDDALVINTAEVTEGGILGLGGRKFIELTATPPVQGRLAPTRRPSLIEKKYAEEGALIEIFQGASKSSAKAPAELQYGDRVTLPTPAVILSRFPK